MLINKLKIACVFIITILFAGSSLIPNLIAQENHQSDHEQNKEQVKDWKIQEIIDKINETLIRNFMEHLVFEIGCRYTGSYGCQKAAQYIDHQFENMDLRVKYQNWTAHGNRWHPGLFISQNIEATHIGTDPIDDEVIVFNAHYDTV